MGTSGWNQISPLLFGTFLPPINFDHSLQSIRIDTWMVDVCMDLHGLQALAHMEHFRVRSVVNWQLLKVGDT